MHQLFAVADAANRLPLPIDLLSAAREMKSIQAYAVMSDMPADHDSRGLGRVQLPWELQCRQALASPGASDGIQAATGYKRQLAKIRQTVSSFANAGCGNIDEAAPAAESRGFHAAARGLQKVR